MTAIDQFEAAQERLLRRFDIDAESRFPVGGEDLSDNTKSRGLLVAAQKLPHVQPSTRQLLHTMVRLRGVAAHRRTPHFCGCPAAALAESV